MSIVRVIPQVATVVYDAVNELHIPLTSGQEFDSADPLVAQFPGLFAADGESTRPARQRITSVEMASAEPGTKRNR